MMPTVPDSDELIDLIYGAAYGETSWHDFLDRSRQILPNGQAVLFHHDQAKGRGATSMGAGFDESMLERYSSYYSAVNPWMPHARLRRLGHVTQADELLPRRRLMGTEYYADYLRPQDIETGIGVTLRRDKACDFFFSIICARVDEDQAQSAKQTLQVLVPHLRRAFTEHPLSSHDARRSTARTEGPCPSPRGVVRLRHDLRVAFADELATARAALSDRITVERFGRFHSTCQPLMEFVQAAMSGSRAEHAALSQVFHVPRTDGGLPLRITVHRPGRRSVAFVSGAAECILQIDDPATGIPAAAEAFSLMHHLSPSEGKIVEGLAKGLTLVEVATRNGTSPATVRTQLRSIFLKTELGRQSDIVRHVCILAGALRG
jgi:DNA-binding CsgD family transcriptional regulator